MYRYSPIQDIGRLLEAIRYVADATSRMAHKICGQSFPITSLTIFSHDAHEFRHLVELLSTMGVPFNENNGPRVALYDPIEAGTNRITHVRIRKPDPERPQVGCNDFEVENYEIFKGKYLEKSAYLKLIIRPEYEMIEFKHPDFDVLAYVVSH